MTQREESESAGRSPGDPDALRALARRLDDQAATSARIGDSLAQLAESLGRVDGNSRRRERALALNSFVAYILFTVLLGGAFYVLYRGRAGDLVRERDRAVAQRDAARKRAADLQSALAARDASAKKALAFYGLVRKHRRAAILGGYPTLDRKSLTPTERAVFAAAVREARARLFATGLADGIDAYRRHQDAAATRELRRALTYASETARRADAHYYLGRALAAQGSYAEAARQLGLALAGGGAGEQDARFYRAAALEALGNAADARAEYQKFAAAHPHAPLAGRARRKAAALARSAGK